MGSNRKQPFGYKIEGGRLVTHPEEKTWVVHIFHRYNGGASFQEVADEMNAAGFPYEEGKDWNKNMVSRILADCRYAGDKGYPIIIGWEELEIAADRRSAKQCQRQLTPVQKLLKKKCSCKVTLRIEQAVLNLLNDLTMYPEKIATPRTPIGASSRMEACKAELEDLLRQLPVSEQQAQEKLMELAAAMYETIDSREYETTRMRRYFQQSELRTELDTEVIAKAISGIWITETGRIAIMLKNEQVMETEV